MMVYYNGFTWRSSSRINVPLVKEKQVEQDLWTRSLAYYAHCLILPKWFLVALTCKLRKYQKVLLFCQMKLSQY